MIVHKSAPLAMTPAPYDRNWDGTRRPSNFADPADSGIELPDLTWPQQYRILKTIRSSADFRREMLQALGLEGLS